MISRVGSLRVTPKKVRTRQIRRLLSRPNNAPSCRSKSRSRRRSRIPASHWNTIHTVNEVPKKRTSIANSVFQGVADPKSGEAVGPQRMATKILPTKAPNQANCQTSPRMAPKIKPASRRQSTTISNVSTSGLTSQHSHNDPSSSSS